MNVPKAYIGLRTEANRKVLAVGSDCPMGSVPVFRGTGVTAMRSGVPDDTFSQNEDYIPSINLCYTS